MNIIIASTALTVELDIVEDPTLWDTIADVAREAGRLAREALLVVRVLEWDGPGGGNPFVALTFASDEGARLFLTAFHDGDLEQVEDDLEAARRAR